MSHVAVMLAGADSPGEHLQLGAFTAVAAVVFVSLGRWQRRTGRSLGAPNEPTVMCGQLVLPPEPSRGKRAVGCVWIVLGGLFVLSAVVNTADAVYELMG